MKLPFCSIGTSETTEPLMAAVRRAAPAVELEICGNFADLLRRLCQRKGDLSVVILCASSREDLAEIISLRQWLHDLRTILILPGRDSSTLAGGLTLWPRFVSFVDTDFVDVSTVLKNILRIYGKEAMAC
jgi:hypothetical protein